MPRPVFRFFTLLLSLSTFGIGIIGCHQSNDEPTDYSQDKAFTDVTLIPMTGDTEQSLPHQTVWIRGEKIFQIGPSSEVNLPEEVEQIDGSGKFLMPGLAEMHAHIPVPQGDKDSLLHETLLLWLANGITTIRGMLGDPFHLQLRTMIAQDEILSPRMYTSGPSMNGNTCPNDSIAIARVRSQKEAGYDFLKLHPGLTREVFDAIVSTANELGIPYAGHVSLEVGIEHALRSGYASVDHVDGYMEGLVPPNAGIDKYENGFFGFAFTQVADTTRIRSLAKLTAEKGVAIVPTQSLMVRWTSPKDPQLMKDEPEMKYMHPRTVANWIKSQGGIQNAAYYKPEDYQAFIEIRQLIIKALHEEGVLMLLGSDSPQVYNVPGFSIHHELQAVVDAGLTPFEALQSGTINPAKFLGEEGKFGTLEEGAFADCILLSSNPLLDISTLQQNEGVMLRGTWLSKEFLQTSLQAIADRYLALN